jgi:predicted O-methyltransferase YrrM
MPSFAKTLLWYLQRPAMYPELAHLVTRKVRRLLGGKDEIVEARALAGAWCAGIGISADEALSRITGNVIQPSLREKFSDVFAHAEMTANACPIKMGGAGDIDLLYRLAEFSQAQRVIETGVAYGWSSLVLLLSLKARDGLLVSSDLPYPGMDNDPYVGCVVPNDLRDNWKLLRGADRQVLAEALKLSGTIDLCHYDSDKSYAGRKWTYPQLWAALRPGGIFISDDIGDNMGFRDFAQSINIDPIVVQSNERFVGILLKPVSS